jgi:hypothetical protein
MHYKKNLISLGTQTVAVYASSHVSTALQAMLGQMNLYDGVKLTQILGAVYDQGRKDGARAAFESVTEKVHEAEATIPHRNPGKPKKPKKKRK